MLLLVLGAGRLARRTAHGIAPPGAAPMQVRGAIALGPRRRLYLVEADGARALILIGGGTDVALLLPRP